MSFLDRKRERAEKPPKTRVDNVAEWLRRQPAKLMGFARVGSNPTVVVFFLGRRWVVPTNFYATGTIEIFRTSLFLSVGHGAGGSGAAGPRENFSCRGSKSAIPLQSRETNNKKNNTTKRFVCLFLSLRAKRDGSAVLRPKKKRAEGGFEPLGR